MIHFWTKYYSNTRQILNDFITFPPKDKGKCGVNGFLILCLDIWSTKKKQSFTLKRHLEPYQGVCKVDILRNLSILKFVFFILDRNVWPKIVTTSQCSITMANARLLVFICKRVEIFFVKEDQGREFFIIFLVSMKFSMWQ